jgi:hypothetical protein
MEESSRLAHPSNGCYLTECTRYKSNLPDNNLNRKCCMKVLRKGKFECEGVCEGFFDSKNV